jgi:hypothetical protein
MEKKARVQSFLPATTALRGAVVRMSAGPWKERAAVRVVANMLKV